MCLKVTYLHTFTSSSQAAANYPVIIVSNVEEYAVWIVREFCFALQPSATLITFMSLLKLRLSHILHV